jgi:hypothetical protein
MKIRKNEPPRSFRVGKQADREIRDSGDIHLEPDEQVTFVTDSGRRHDFARKAWGFYATPSINGRLEDEGFRTALIRNQQGQMYVTVVEVDKQVLFEKYCEREEQTVLEWLSDATSERPNQFRGRVG